MATFSVGSFGSSGSTSFRGESFTPNVAGPDGVGGPGSATTVYLQSASVGYTSSSTAGRAAIAYLYAAVPTLANLNNNGMGSIAQSTTTTDEADLLGTGSYSRTFTFSSIALDPANQYYILFSSNQTLRYATGNPYTGGKAYNTVLAGTTNDVQFSIGMADTV